MKLYRRSRRYKGYGSPGWFNGGGAQLRFSNRRLFLTLALVVGLVALMIWGLNHAKGAC